MDRNYSGKNFNATGQIDGVTFNRTSGTTELLHAVCPVINVKLYYQLDRMFFKAIGKIPIKRNK